MKRTTIWLDDIKQKKLKALSEKTGAPVSALIRKAIGEYLKKKQEAGRAGVATVCAARQFHISHATLNQLCYDAISNFRAATRRGPIATKRNVGQRFAPALF